MKLTLYVFHTVLKLFRDDESAGVQVIGRMLFYAFRFLFDKHTSTDRDKYNAAITKLERISGKSMRPQFFNPDKDDHHMQMRYLVQCLLFMAVLAEPMRGTVLSCVKRCVEQLELDATKRDRLRIAMRAMCLKMKNDYICNNSHLPKDLLKQEWLVADAS